MGKSKKECRSQATADKRNTPSIRVRNAETIYKNYYPTNYPRQGVFRQMRYPHRTYFKYQSNLKGGIRFNQKFLKKRPSRPPSPVQGSEEYMNKKIKETSAIIMMQLLNPEHQLSSTSNRKEEQRKQEPNKRSHKIGAKITDKPETSTKSKNKKALHADIEEIHKKILNHITKLNDGRKKNLINSGTSGYDVVIQQIQQQKRLEISRAFRDMCSRSDESHESSQFINSIIPDIGIKVEELPRDLLEELRNTLNNDFNFSNFDDEFWNMNSPDAINPTLGNQLETNNLNPSSFTNNDNVTTSSQVIKTVNIKKEILESTNTENSQIKEELGSNEISNTDSKKEVCDNLNSNQKDSLASNSDIIQNHDDKNKETLQKFVKSEPDDFTKNNTSSIKENIFENTEMDEYPENDTSYNKANVTDKIVNKFEEDDIKIEYNKIDVPIDSLETATEEKFQTNNDTNLLSSISTQTEEENRTVKPDIFIDAFLKSCFKDLPRSFTEIIERTFKIDECISQLTRYRQDLFKDFIRSNKTSETIDASITTVNNDGAENLDLEDISYNRSRNELRIRRERKERLWRNSVGGNIKRAQKRKAGNTQNINGEPQVKKIDVLKDTDVNETGSDNTEKNTSIHPSQTKVLMEDTCGPNLLNFQEVHEKMLVIKVCENVLVAGSESGKLFYYSKENGDYIKTLEASTSPITSLLFRKFAIYVGSYENNLKIYHGKTHRLLKCIDIDDSIQCMEMRWGYIFIGCVRGSLLRYSSQKRGLEYADKFSDDRILVLKATQEGARRVLLVGSRNAPVCIRDAMTGLHMRTMENIVSPTTYSLILRDNLVYCGTTSHNILVFSFYDGKLLHTYDAAKAKGISCMKITGNLLFASCHNGSIYVYDIKENVFIDSIEGPGGVILAMILLENQVIVSTMLFKFKSIPIPEYILKHKHKN